MSAGSHSNRVPIVKQTGKAGGSIALKTQKIEQIQLFFDTNNKLLKKDKITQFKMIQNSEIKQLEFNVKTFFLIFKRSQLFLLHFQLQN